MTDLSKVDAHFRGRVAADGDACQVAGHSGNERQLSNRPVLSVIIAV